MQITIGTKQGETYQTEKEKVSQLHGKKIGDKFDGSIIGLEGYKMKITGGSDQDGFPMREGIEGTGRRKMLLKEGTGITKEEEGKRKRKSVRGETVSEEIQQLNTKVIEKGEEEISDLLNEG